MSEDCCRYGLENINENILAKAAAIYGDALKHVEQEQDDLNRQLSSQVDFFPCTDENNLCIFFDGNLGAFNLLLHSSHPLDILELPNLFY